MTEFLKWRMNVGLGTFPGRQTSQHFTILVTWAGYKQANDDWISKVLIGLDPGVRQPHTFSMGISQPMDTWDNMVTGLGSVSNLDRLAILHGSINGQTTVFAGKNYKSEDAKNSPRIHRNTYGVFSYMNQPTIWAAFVASP